MCVVASSLDVARALTGTVQSHRLKNELIGHSRGGAFKPRLRVESNGCNTGLSVQIMGHTMCYSSTQKALLVSYMPLANSRCLTIFEVAAIRRPPSPAHEVA